MREEKCLSEEFHTFKTLCDGQKQSLSVAPLSHGEGQAGITERVTHGAFLVPTEARNTLPPR